MVRRIKAKLVLRLRAEGLTGRQIAAQGMSRHSVSAVLDAADREGVGWDDVAELDEANVYARLFPGRGEHESVHAQPDWDKVHRELARVGVTLKLLHGEYVDACRAKGETAMGYDRFCKTYQRHVLVIGAASRVGHKAGQTVEVDWSGKTMQLSDPVTGQATRVYLFVATLPFSRYSFVEPTLDMKQDTWLRANTAMFDWFGGSVPRIVPDNLKSAVTKADRHSPVINETYQAMCRYYHVTPFPARPYKPKDKPRAEGAVLLAQRRILFVLRRRKFFSLEEANREIRVLLDRLNHKPFQKREGSRFSQWQECELPALQALPATPYEVAEWGKVRAGMDYHVLIDRHYYSVPYQLRGREFEYRMTDKAIDLICKGKTVVLHQRSNKAGGTTTLDEHKSPAHQAVQQTDEDALSWAAEVGPNTVEVMRLQLGKGNAHLMVYRITQSMKSLAKAHTPSRLEEACTYALANRITDVPSIRNILSKQLDKLFSPSSSAAEDSAAHKVIHENIRGAQYYDHILNSDEEKQSC